MKVVITGGAGFIGTNLAIRMQRDEIDVVVFDDFSSGTRENVEASGAPFIDGSILEDAALDEAFHGVHAVVHLAARPSVPLSLADPMASHEVNATGTLKVLEACRRNMIAFVAVASSSSVYGANPTIPKTEDLTPMPMSPYAVSKLAAESYAISYQECFELRTIAFRFFNVYGPFQRADHAYAAVIPAFIDAAFGGRPLLVNGDGEQFRDFTHVDDVTEVLTRAVVASITSERPVNLAFGSRASILDLITVLEDLMGRSLEREHRNPRVGDIQHSRADEHRLRELFPDLRPVALRNGLESTVRWYEEKLKSQ
jgi:UDP-glucose 4-epimerase